MHVDPARRTRKPLRPGIWAGVAGLRRRQAVRGGYSHPTRPDVSSLLSPLAFDGAVSPVASPRGCRLRFLPRRGADDEPSGCGAGGAGGRCVRGARCRGFWELRPTRRGSTTNPTQPAGGRCTFSQAFLVHSRTEGPVVACAAAALAAPAGVARAAADIRGAA